MLRQGYVVVTEHAKQSEIKKLEGDLTRLKQHLIESQQENEMAVVDLKSTFVFSLHALLSEY